MLTNTNIATSYDSRLSQHQQFGATLEKWAANELASLGYHCQLMPDWNHQYDLLIDHFLPVEIKAAKPTAQWTGKCWRQRWQFCTQSKLRRQDYVFILIAIADGALYPYIIPSSFVGNRMSLNITSHPERYRGWMAEHLNAWRWIETVYHWRQKYESVHAGQLSLFEGVAQ
jgi:hypothetical protein